MKTFSVVAVVVLFVYSAGATPCTDICNAQCTIQQQSCAFTEIFGNLCDTINGVCTQACAAACGCADSCAAQCGGEYATCKGGDAGPLGGVFNVLSCGIGLSVCSSTCQLQCNFNLLAGIVNSVGGAGGGAPPPVESL
ncbi:hypothetical protein ElyMa_003374000 [Elysia marginata]|uniref:Uncharacterized protein n=1 Tax=Elysia marginata TaxID=1093978 RepID=A0AAV4JN85_9GAST|nr:hypothetical protein ElyMa_003374000 [Elysia marginata]